MSRRKPDKVIEYRFSLQDTERAMFEQALAVYSIEKSFESLNDFLSFENLYIGITIYEMITGEEILYGTPNDINDIVGATKTWWQRQDEAQFDAPFHQGFAMYVKNWLVAALGISEEPFPIYEGPGV